MKMFLKSMLALLALVFVMGSYDVKAQCPPGYTSVTFTKIVPGIGAGGANCEVKFTVCVFEQTNPGPPPFTELFVQLQSFEFLDASCMAGVTIGTSTFLDKMRAAILEESSTFGTIPPCDINGMPNTTPMTHVVRFSSASCMQGTVSNVGKPGSGTTIVDHYTIKISLCPDAQMICKRDFLVCMDYGTTPPQEHYFPFLGSEQEPISFSCPPGD